ncbi:unnamed protein product [Mytilus coruscus]|uniref:Ig-like domain-containing protein n=1 Tax=Mytilus coruscus TaxID=42192 RepID=A0A6J8CVV8_MYTCO|nr:unnamed protein product [Mytilus coruscus]
MVEAGVTNNDPKIVAGYYIQAVIKKNGCSRSVRSNFGTENKYVDQMQRFFHRNGIDSDHCYIYGSSTQNQRIECLWAILRKQCAQFWRDLFTLLKQHNKFDGSYLDQNLVWFCFMGLIQENTIEVKQSNSSKSDKKHAYNILRATILKKTRNRCGVYVRKLFSFLHRTKKSANRQWWQRQNRNTEMWSIVVMLTVFPVAFFQNIRYVKLEDTVELQCPTRSESSEIIWFGPKHVTPISRGRTIYKSKNSHRFEVFGDFSIGEYHLRIINIKISDVGIYKCTISVLKRTYQYEFDIKLEKPPTDLTIKNTESGNIIHATEGRDLILECQVISGVPKESLIWIHRGIELNESNSGVAKLVISPRVAYHLDQFTCKAESSALKIPLSKTVTLMVQL